MVKRQGWKKTEYKHDKSVVFDYLEFRDGVLFNKSKIIVSRYYYSPIKKWQVMGNFGYDIDTKFFTTKDKAIKFASKLKKQYPRG